jgi:Ca-activated chloride channel family protein
MQSAHQNVSQIVRRREMTRTKSPNYKSTNLRIYQLLITAITTIVLLLSGARPTLADGVIIPDPPPWPEPVPLRETWLTIRYHRVTVTIEDQVAVTRVEQEFLNEHDWEAEGTYVFPLPEGAAVSEFIMWVDGVPVEGKILEADEARQIYEDRAQRHPGPHLPHPARRLAQGRTGVQPGAAG